jgi:acyl carrier protein
MTDDVIKALKFVLVNALFVEVPEDQIGVDDGLQSVLGLDSVSFVELRVHCEDIFRVRISDDDFSPENFRSLNRLAQLITKLRSGLEVVDAN